MEIYKQNNVSRISAVYGWKSIPKSVLCIGVVINADVQRYTWPFDVSFVTRAARRLSVSIYVQILGVSCI